MKLCIIPARGGSKRIPGKNMASGCFDKVIVSTDDEKIASVAKSYGAEIPFMRPDDLADDFTNTADVVKHAIEFYTLKKISISAVCCIYATAPFVEKKYLMRGYKQLMETKSSYAFSVTSFAFPIQRAIKIIKSKLCGLMRYKKDLRI